MSEGFAELSQFFFGAMYFEPGEDGDSQRRIELGGHVIEVSEQAFGAFVSFAAVHYILMKAEAVVEAVGFSGGGCDELVAEVAKCGQFSFVHLEVGVDGYVAILWHRAILSWP